MTIPGFATPLEAVLSGHFELCIPRGDEIGNAFIRNASFKVDGKWTDAVSVKVSAEDATEIKLHKCVKAGMKGSLYHYHTRRFPVQPA